MTCAWADYTGFHVGTCPENTPPYTHLWAWTPPADFLIRARIDEGEAIIGALAKNPVPSLPKPPGCEKLTTVREETQHTWSPEDKRIGSQAEPALVLPTRVHAFITQTPVPITFIACPNSPGEGHG
jgi:hypothetical protein